MTPMSFHRAFKPAFQELEAAREGGPEARCEEGWVESSWTRYIYHIYIYIMMFDLKQYSMNINCIIRYIYNYKLYRYI